MNRKQYKVGKTYNIAFMDHRQAEYTWYSGKAVYLRESSEDFGTGEKHHILKTPDGNECTFPESSIGPKVE